MNFRTFLRLTEAEDWNALNASRVGDDSKAQSRPARPVKPLSNPDDVANYWKEVDPDKDGSPAVINTAEARVMGKAMADNDKNASDWHMATHGRPVYDVRYGPKAIAGNLIKVNDPRLADAQATILTSENNNAELRFYKSGPKAGSFRIQHPPVSWYSPTDESLIEGIIAHELQHAADFTNPKYDDVPPSVEVWFDNNLYAKNLMEARAYAKQLNYLLQKLNYDTGAVLRVLKGRRSIEGLSPLRMDADILRAAEIYLQNYKKSNENWFTKLAAPFVLGTSMALGSDIAPKMPDPPQAVRVEQQQEVYQAAKMVHKIITLGSLSNFLQK